MREYKYHLLRTVLLHPDHRPHWHIWISTFEFSSPVLDGITIILSGIKEDGLYSLCFTFIKFVVRYVPSIRAPLKALLKLNSSSYQSGITIDDIVAIGSDSSNFTMSYTRLFSIRRLLWFHRRKQDARFCLHSQPQRFLKYSYIVQISEQLLRNDDRWALCHWRKNAFFLSDLPEEVLMLLPSSSFHLFCIKQTAWLIAVKTAGKLCMKFLFL